MPVSDEWSCPRCHRGTAATGSPADVQAALDGVRDRHNTGHRAGDHVLDDIGLAGASARSTARSRRAAARAAARRRRNKADRT